MDIINQGFELGKATNMSFVYQLHTGKLAYLAPNLLSFFGKELSELSVSAIQSLVHTDDLAYIEKAIAQLKNDNFSGNICFRLSLKGQEKWIRATPFLFRNERGLIIAGNAIDVTAEVHNLNATEKYANKKNSTLNIIAHDLRGPLGIARSISNVLAKNLEDDQSLNQVNYISTIIKQSITLINSLVEREFMDTVHVELVKKRINIAGKAKEYFEEYIIAAETLKRSFSFSSSDTEIYVELDEAKIMQVFNNLFTNALKFTPEGAHIRLNIEDRPDTIMFCFSDTGIGIPEAMQPVLFEKFTPARRIGLNGEPTIGVGLSIVKTIIEWHGGTISVESEVNKGTTFIFELPKQPAS